MNSEKNDPCTGHKLNNQQVLSSLIRDFEGISLARLEETKAQLMT
jgi:hypothetical protein